MDYAANVTSLRETIYASITDPRRQTGKQVAADLMADFAEHAGENSSNYWLA